MMLRRQNSFARQGFKSTRSLGLAIKSKSQTKSISDKESTKSINNAV